MKTTQNQNKNWKKCECGRKATSWTFIRGEEKIEYKCGYHTWWFGTHGDPEFHQRCKIKHAIYENNDRINEVQN